MNIDNHVTNSLVNVVTPEYTYSVELLTAAGIDDQNLTATEYATANKAMLYAIAYRLLDLDAQTQIQFPSEPNSGNMRAQLVRQKDQYWRLAGLAWLDLGITSKYYQASTTGFADTVFVQNSSDYQYS